MAKKSFKENPALSFISQALAATPDTSTDKDVYTHTHDDVSADTDAATDTSAHKDTSIESSAMNAKEAAAAFEAAPSPSAKVSPSQETMTNKNVPPLPSGITGRGESKSKRLQLLLRPSTHEGLVRLSKQYRTSVNDVINQILEDFLRRSE